MSEAPGRNNLHPQRAAERDFKRRKMIRFLVAIACILIPASGALGQAQSQAQLDRFNQQLQETERQSRLLVDQSIPARRPQR